VADVDNVNSADNNLVNENRSIQSDSAAAILIHSSTDPKTGAVDTRQLAADVSGAKDFHTASQAYEQIEAELSRRDPKIAAQFSRDVADAFASRNSAVEPGQSSASGVSAPDIDNRATPPRLAQLLESKGIPVNQNVPTSATTAAASAPEGTAPSSTPRIENVPPTSLRFSQKDVGATTGDGQPLQDVVRSMQTGGWKGGPVDAVQWEDGSLTSVDNRRVLSAQNAKLNEMPVQIHDMSDPIPSDQAGRFTLKSYNIRQLGNGELVAGGTQGQVLYRKGSIPGTWGEAAIFRGADQGNVKGAGRFPLRGTYDQPAVRPGRGAPPTASVEEGTPSARAGTSAVDQPPPSTSSVSEGKPSLDPASRSFGVKEGTVAGAAIGATVSAAQLALTGKLNLQNLKEVAKGAGEGAAIGAVATKAEQVLTPVIDRTVGAAVQKGATQLATTVASEGAADTAGVVARTLATRVAGATVVGAAITTGISAWENRDGLAHGDSRAIGNVVADTAVGAGSIAAATVAGAAVGSVVPVAGTAVGAVVGLAVGVGITYGAQISGVRNAIADGAAHGVDGIKDAAKSIGSGVSNATNSVAHFFGF
jgi:hypothetical protein